ncbi:hypothetical protein VTH82DRAFT_90 [Thermothelomyces myriococcoides]
MPTTPRTRPCAAGLDIHDDHSHDNTTATTLGKLSLNQVHNIRRKASVESLSRQLDDLHIHNSDNKENKSRLLPGEVASRDPAFESAQEPKSLQDSENSNLLALASQQVRSTKEQLLRHQEGQFEWLLSVPVKSAAKGRGPRGDSHGDAEPGRGGKKTLYFGCNLVSRKPQSDEQVADGRSTDVYTLLATRVKAEEDFIIEQAPVFDEMEAAAADQPRPGDDVGTSKASPEPIMDINGAASASDNSSTGEHSRPLSRIEDSVEALDKLEEEIEAVAEVAQLERVLSPEGGSPKANGASAKSTPMKRATSVRAAPDSAKSKTVERSASVRTKTTSSGDDEKAATPSARRVPRPASLLPPKPLAKSTKPPTTSNFELPGEAVARQLKERRAQRQSQQISPEQAAAMMAAYYEPRAKSTKAPTRPTFELPGEAISRKKREKREAELRAQEEEERKRREFKARPIRASLTPTTVPRETLTSLARQKARASTEGSGDSASTTATPVSKKRQSVMTMTTTPSSTSATRTTTTTTPATLPMRGRNPTASTSTDSASPTPRAASVSSSTAASTHSRTSRVSAEEAAQQKLRGKEVFARDNSLAAERERERRERERAAKEAREKAAERSRELSRQWAEKQRLKKEAERRKGGGCGEAPASSPAAAAATV